MRLGLDRLYIPCSGLYDGLSGWRVGMGFTKVGFLHYIRLHLPYISSPKISAFCFCLSP